MKVYSKSQGKLIDAPTSEGAGYSMPADTGSPMSEGISPLQLLLGGAAAKKGQYGTAWSILGGREAQETPSQKAGRKTASRVLQQLEDLYFTKQGQPKLAYGRLGGLFETAMAKAGYNPTLTRYSALRDSIRPALVKAMGDVGNISVAEQQWAIKSLPTAFSTPEEAIGFFQDMRTKLGLPLRK